jgi:hypothetical protein
MTAGFPGGYTYAIRMSRFELRRCEFPRSFLPSRKTERNAKMPRVFEGVVDRNGNGELRHGKIKLE